MNIRTFRAVAACALLAGSVGMPAFAADVGVSIGINQPGFYGRIDIGDMPRPVVLYPQPVVVQPVPVARPPIYLRVPPGHSKDWKRYCGKYGACNQPVYFVTDGWYRDVYVPEYERRHGHERGGRGEGRGHGKGHGHGKHERD